MPCTIVDYLTSSDQNNVAVPLIGEVITAQPTLVPLWLYNAALGAYEVDITPLRRTLSGVHGVWSLTLPQPSESRPNSAEWIITLPDGTSYVGTVPSLVGPIGLLSLQDTFGWQQSTSAGVLLTSSVSPGTVLTVTTPAFPAAGQTVTNTSGVQVMAFITTHGAASFAPTVNGTALPYGGAATLALVLPAGATFAPGNYTGGTPTWLWYGYSPPNSWPS